MLGILLSSCGRYADLCPVCGSECENTLTDTVEHDIATPYRLDKGLKCVTENGDELVIYSDSLILRRTQTMRREADVCASCSFVKDRRYYPIMTEYKNAEYSLVHSYLERIGSGEMVCDFGWSVGAIIVRE